MAIGGKAKPNGLKLWNNLLQTMAKEKGVKWYEIIRHPKYKAEAKKRYAVIKKENGMSSSGTQKKQKGGQVGQVGKVDGPVPPDNAASTVNSASLPGSPASTEVEKKEQSSWLPSIFGGGRRSRGRRSGVKSCARRGRGRGRKSTRRRR
jgi:hypothetical protein